MNGLDSYNISYSHFIVTLFQVFFWQPCHIQLTNFKITNLLFLSGNEIGRGYRKQKFWQLTYVTRCIFLMLNKALMNTYKQVPYCKKKGTIGSAYFQIFFDIFCSPLVLCQLSSQSCFTRMTLKSTRCDLVTEPRMIRTEHQHMSHVSSHPISY